MGPTWIIKSTQSQQLNQAVLHRAISLACHLKVLKGENCLKGNWKISMLGTLPALKGVASSTRSANPSEWPQFLFPGFLKSSSNSTFKRHILLPSVVRLVSLFKSNFLYFWLCWTLLLCGPFSSCVDQGWLFFCCWWARALSGQAAAAAALCPGAQVLSSCSEQA